MQDKNTSFGFEDVSFEEKVRRVTNVFKSVAPHYDLMNDLMSGGLHRFWKDEMIKVVRPAPAGRYLDVAAGTGDIARRLKKALPQDDTSEIYLCDRNPAMLSTGRDNALDQGDVDRLTWVCGDAEALPFPDDSFDAYTIAFGLRNVSRLDLALQEARRVLKPGGLFVCLEFSKVRHPLLRSFYQAYAFHIIPKVGALVASDADAYRYLVESIERFPEQSLLCAHMKDAGFGRVTYKNMTFGIVALHSGVKIETK
ncbi:MAG: bifunctional demethylmenaquinone methyltransferase/2-methoxy-6-polyprenyl-1,4-benzoquinol methylase UbiE [Alphaproteobacteria bacterium]|jgi:demethylmenaquinone methyltransferase/2-methoxy-6-polyprenyl-1,4-benzoquinol methylase|nr:bifunctional demethylmenaquinone methyltransferase/2-methoxy-6-polyprenyl-1,4-benzoquinol methylase UbiE [Alphaproteobacteria bacterium]